MRSHSMYSCHSSLGLPRPMGKQAASEMTVVSTTARNIKVPVFPRHNDSICFTDLCTSGIAGSYVTSAFNVLGTSILFSRRASSFHMPTKRYPKQQMYKLQQNNARNMKKQNNMTCIKKKIKTHHLLYSSIPE